MKAIVSRARTDGSIPEVGTGDRMVVSGLKTEQGVIRRARAYARGKAFRVEFFTDARFYSDPYKTVFCPQGQF